MPKRVEFARAKLDDVREKRTNRGLCHAKKRRRTTQPKIISGTIILEQDSCRTSSSHRIPLGVPPPLHRRLTLVYTADTAGLQAPRRRTKFELLSRDGKKRNKIESAYLRSTRERKQSKKMTVSDTAYATEEQNSSQSPPDVVAIRAWLLLGGCCHI